MTDHNKKSMTGAENATFLPPVGPVSNPTGFVAPVILRSDQPAEVKQMMARVAAQVAHDPMVMQQFCDRVYQLLCDDVRAQYERAHSYRRRC